LELNGVDFASSDFVFLLTRFVVLIFKSVETDEDFVEDLLLN